jgi:two-component system copper resistance phosphate regulon response regulator CusR
MKILIVEDDKDIAELVRCGLAAELHTAEIAPDGAEGSFLARSYEYDVIVLDYSLPKKDGLIVCKEIRGAGKLTPIIFLSVNDDTDIKVSAFNYGADDYLTKPFSFAELYARIQAITRRTPTAKRPVLKIGDLILDTNKHQVKRNGKEIHLTRKEFGILEYLILNQGTIVSRAILMEHVWTADSDPFSNTVEAHIRNLRRKINRENKPDLITNIPGRGYMMGHI